MTPSIHDVVQVAAEGVRRGLLAVSAEQGGSVGEGQGKARRGGLPCYALKERRQPEHSEIPAVFPGDRCEQMGPERNTRPTGKGLVEVLGFDDRDCHVVGRKSLPLARRPWWTTHANHDSARFPVALGHLDHVADRPRLTPVQERQGIGHEIDDVRQEAMGIRGGFGFEPRCDREVKRLAVGGARHPGRVVDGDGEVSPVEELLERLSVLSAKS